MDIDYFNQKQSEEEDFELVSFNNQNMQVQQFEKQLSVSSQKH
jgi:hypothetical protein